MKFVLSKRALKNSCGIIPYFLCQQVRKELANEIRYYTIAVLRALLYVICSQDYTYGFSQVVHISYLYFNTSLELF